MNAPQSEQRQERRGGYVDYDDLRQFVRDLVAPLIERLDNLRDEVHEIKRRPQQEVENRRGDMMIIIGVVGAIVGLATCGSGFLYIATSIWLHFMK